MADNSSIPVNVESKSAGGARPAAAPPVVSLRREIDRLFEDFERGLWSWPFGRSAGRSLFDMMPSGGREIAAASPSVDIVEKDKAFEITAELPGMDEKNVEVKLANGTLTIRGEKTEEKEEKEKDYHLSERRYGSFERRFGLPEGIDTDKIEAAFKNGVLTVVLPKSATAQDAEKKIAVKPG
jgi:HSP20 family protein